MGGQRALFFSIKPQPAGAYRGCVCLLEGCGGSEFYLGPFQPKASHPREERERGGGEVKNTLQRSNKWGLKPGTLIELLTTWVQVVKYSAR